MRTIGVPDDASVLMMNVTAVPRRRRVTSLCTPATKSVPADVEPQLQRGPDVPNAVAMRIGTDHRIRFRNAVGITHLIVDVTGWYRPGYPVGAHSRLAAALEGAFPAPTEQSRAISADSQPDVAQWLSTDRGPTSRGDHHAA